MQRRSGVVRSMIRVLIVISLHFMKIFFHHENAKFRKHEIYLVFFRVFVLSCFRD
jgi:hypothetical protein